MVEEEFAVYRLPAPDEPAAHAVTWDVVARPLPAIASNGFGDPHLDGFTRYAPEPVDWRGVQSTMNPWSVMPYEPDRGIPDPTARIPDAWLAKAILLAKPHDERHRGAGFESIAVTAAPTKCENVLTAVNLTETDRDALQVFYLGGVNAESTAVELRERGRTHGATLAHDVADYFLLAASIQIKDAAQPRHIKRAVRRGSRLLRVILSLARRGLRYMRSLLTLSDRDLRLLDELQASGALALALRADRDARMHENVERAPGLEPQPASDAPARSQPRETRAGPEDEEPEHPAGHPFCPASLRSHRVLRWLI